MRLFTIPLSHYCERARWALDRAALPYHEDRHLQGFHLRAVRKVSTGHQVPVLVTEDRVLTDSQDIVAFANAQGAQLSPPCFGDEARQLERAIADEFGVETRRLAYFLFLPLPRATVLRYNNTGAPRLQRWASWPLLGTLKRKVTKYIDISPQTAAQSREVIVRTLDTLTARLSDGRPYLAGDTFSSLDLTYAALVAPLWRAAASLGCPLPGLPTAGGGASGPSSRRFCHGNLSKPSPRKRKLAPREWTG